MNYYTAAWADLVADLREANATIGRVKALHVIDGKHARLHWCANDKMSWPCPTIRALEQP